MSIKPSILSTCFLALLLASVFLLTSCAKNTVEPIASSEAASSSQSQAASSAAPEAASQAASTVASAPSAGSSSATAASAAASSAATVETAATPPAGTRDATAWARVPTASGTTLLGNASVEIDASNTAEGYVMVRYTGSNSNVKLQLTPDGGSTYTYDLSTGGNYETFPLVAGSGGYTLNVFENVSGDQYAQVCGDYFQANLNSTLLPFLYPNQYVNFWQGCDTVVLGSQLASGANNDLDVVNAVYDWTISHITYDFDKASAVSSGGLAGYVPNVDSIVSSGKGICFDYAAVMVAMLRSQRIPTKLVVGYAGEIYHAWISVYITDVGWVNDVIYFDGTSWVRMDPTFASSGNSSKDIMQYIGNGNNYNAVLVY